jgi:hypothetical protein
MTIDSSHLHDFKVDKPEIYDKFSDLCVVFTTDGLITMAQYGKDGYWHGEGDETFGNVTHWFDAYPIPRGFKLEESRYGGEI